MSHLWSNNGQESDQLATSLGALDRHIAHHNYVHSSLFERVLLGMILRCMYMCVDSLGTLDRRIAHYNYVDVVSFYVHIIVILCVCVCNCIDRA